MLTKKASAAILISAIPIILFFAFRWFWFEHKFEPQASLDTPAYLRMAEGLMTGHGFAWDSDARRTPTYPLFLGAVFLLSGQDNQTAIVFSQIILSALAIISIYSVVYIIFSSIWLSVLTASIIAVLPSIASFEIYILTESISVTLVGMLLLVTMLYAQRPSTIIALLLGANLAALALARPTFVPLIVAVPIYIGLAQKYVPEWQFSKKNIGLIVAIAVVIPAIWSIRTQIRYGLLFSSQSGYSATQHAGGFWDDVEYESEIDDQLQSIYQKYREQQIERTGYHANTVFHALPEMRERTGLSEAEISDRLLHMSVIAIVRNPIAYYDSIILATNQYWQPDLVMRPTWFSGSRLMWLYQAIWRFVPVTLIMVTSGLAAILLYRRRPFYPQEAFLGLNFLIIANVTIISCLAEYAENFRLRAPAEPSLIIFIFTGAYWISILIRQTQRHWNTELSSYAAD